MFTDFEELHGDRMVRRRPRDRRRPRALRRPAGAWSSATRRAATPRSRCCATSACRSPEGYRKALRLMRLAEKFAAADLRPSIDTPGAYPGIGAEERNQSEAIGRNLFEMAQLRVPIVATIIGEGGSGGALADRRSATRADAAVLDVLGDLARRAAPRSCGRAPTRRRRRPRRSGITASRLKTLGLVDKVRRPSRSAARIATPTPPRRACARRAHRGLRQLQDKKPKELVEERLERPMAYGQVQGNCRTLTRPSSRPCGEKRVAVGLSGAVSILSSCCISCTARAASAAALRDPREPWVEPERRRLAALQFFDVS
jgi:acetyl-CoA carboxylase carboxyl transferase subunit alpha